LNIIKIKKPILSLIFIGLCFIFAPIAVYGGTQYVSDNLIIMMRSGVGGDYKIIKAIKTD